MLPELIIGRAVLNVLKDKRKEHRTFKNVNNCLNINIYAYLDISSGKSFNLYLNVVHFFNTIDNYTSVAA